MVDGDVFISTVENVSLLQVLRTILRSRWEYHRSPWSSSEQVMVQRWNSFTTFGQNGTSFWSFEIGISPGAKERKASWSCRRSSLCRVLGWYDLDGWVCGDAEPNIWYASAICFVAHGLSVPAEKAALPIWFFSPFSRSWSWMSTPWLRDEEKHRQSWQRRWGFRLFGLYNTMTRQRAHENNLPERGSQSLFEWLMDTLLGRWQNFTTLGDASFWYRDWYMQRKYNERWMWTPTHPEREDRN